MPASVRSDALMGTIVSIDVPGADGADAEAAIERAFGWFRAIETACSRFDEESELRRLCATAGVPVRVSDMLFEAVHFAVAVAGETGGAFDPTVHSDATFRDVVMDAAARTIALRRPLLLDLGAVAKGLAVDAAARELKPFANFAIDAGGDLYLGGRNARGEPWTVGIRHPRVDGALIDSVRVSDAAVCTSGDYERGAHILDPASGMPAHGVISVTAIAPNALLADAAATAAFVLGPERGLDFLERQGVEGLVVTADLDCRATPGFPRA